MASTKLAVLLVRSRVILIVALDSDSLAESERKSLKSKNKNGSPVRLRSKILAVTADPSCPRNAIFVATSGGNVIRVMVDVGEVSVSLSSHLPSLAC